MASQLYNGAAELKRVALNLLPAQTPQLEYIDIAGFMIPFSGDLGGDHTTYIDFKQQFDLTARREKAAASGNDELAEKLARLQQKAGILLSDVSGHEMTDSHFTGLLHAAVQTGISYELDTGEISQKLFETVSGVMHDVLPVGKYITAIYGEIQENGAFRFITAGHPPPIIYSYEHNEFTAIEISKEEQQPPMGFMPSKTIDSPVRPAPVLGYQSAYPVREVALMGQGDVLLLYTDGLSELTYEDRPYMENSLPSLIAEHRDDSLETMCAAIEEDVRKTNRTDDISLVMIKKQ